MGNSESRGHSEAARPSVPDVEIEGQTDYRHSMPTLRTTTDAETAARTKQFARRRHSLEPATNTTSGDARPRNAARTSNADAAAAEAAAAQVEQGGIERGQQATEEQTNQLGYWYLLKNGYSQLVNLIIRPPRASYELKDLGPTEFSFSGREFRRVDFTVQNDRQQTLQCSQWLPEEHEIHGVSTFPCVIYLHGNSSCRLEALSVLRPCLSAGVTVVAFDCGGSGLSDGEYISLGYFERDDVRAVIQHLREHCNISTIGLWGRSMGAATALLHADRDPTIAAIIVDSAFTDLEQLVQEIVERGRQEGFTIPGILVKIVMRFVRSSVLKRAGFDIRKLVPISHASASFVPALFIAAKGDDFIGPHHSDQLFAAYAGDKNIIKVAGDHNSVRPQFMLDSAGIFLQTTLQIDPRLLPDSDMMEAMIRSAPHPWSTDESPTAHIMLMDLEAALSGAGNGHPRLAPDAEWTCNICTFVNSPLELHCEVCQTPYQPVDLDGVATPIAMSPPRRRSSSPSGATRSHRSDSDDEDCFRTRQLSTSDPLSNRRLTS